MMNHIDSLALLMGACEVLGLPEKDLVNASMYLENHEFGLCLDTLVTQLYDHSIALDEQVYVLIAHIGKSMKLDDTDWNYVRDLVRDRDTFPTPVQEGLRNIFR